MFESFNPLFMVFASYGLGVLGTLIIKFLGLYNLFQNHNYLSDKVTKSTGVLILGYVVRKTFLSKFNQKLKYKGYLNEEKLLRLKKEMTFAENNHLIAFLLFQVLIAFFILKRVAIWQLVIYSLVNVIFNFYLVLLQQYNKRRVDRISNYQKTKR